MHSFIANFIIPSVNDIKYLNKNGIVYYCCYTSFFTLLQILTKEYNYYKVVIYE
nr:MAG TPA: hypothetical protein [Caudoviricetes sp.]